MRAFGIAAAIAVLSLARAAHAQSFIPGNNIDDFGSLIPSSHQDESAPAEKAPGHVSFIPGNNIDDFGPLIASTQQDQSAPAEKAPGHASLIPGNNIDDFTVPGDTVVLISSAEVLSQASVQAPHSDHR